MILQGEDVFGHQPLSRSHELGKLLTVDVNVSENGRRRSGSYSQTTTFEAWREERCTGSVITRSGPPPREWGIPDMQPTASITARLEDADEIRRRMADFANALGAPVSVRYSRLFSRRHILDAIESWCWRDIDVFALTGRISLSNGRFMSLGWSGFGDGFDRMRVGAMSNRFAWIVRAASTASPITPGSGPVVLDSQPAAVMAHEAVGHFCEAAADPSIDLSHRVGCRLASEGFDAFDDPTFVGAARYELDDEGTKTLGPTCVLADGLVAQQLHTRRSANAAATLPTSNARSAQITLPPIPRLSNLVIPQGTTSRAALLDRMGSGLLVHHLSHGFSRGTEIEAQIVLAEDVKSGRPTGRFVSGGRVNERIDVLTRCVERGDHSELNPNALCGKYGQILYDVGTVAPSMFLSSLRISL